MKNEGMPYAQKEKLVMYMEAEKGKKSMTMRAETKKEKKLASASDLSRSPLNGAPLSSTTLWIMVGGLVGSLLFTLVYIIEGASRTGYDAWKLPVSALSLGPGGWEQQANFIAFGLIILCTLPATRKVFAGGVGVTWYPILKGLGGLSFILLGIFSQDPALGYPLGSTLLTTPTIHGSIHMLFSFVSFISSAVGSFVVARRFAKEPRWRGWMAYAIITGLLAIAFVAIYGTLYSEHSAIAGIFERLPGIANSLFGLLFIIKLFQIQRPKIV